MAKCNQLTPLPFKGLSDTKLKLENIHRVQTSVKAHRASWRQWLLHTGIFQSGFSHRNTCPMIVGFCTVVRLFHWIRAWHLHTVNETKSKKFLNQHPDPNPKSKQFFLVPRSTCYKNFMNIHPLLIMLLDKQTNRRGLKHKLLDTLNDDEIVYFTMCWKTRNLVWSTTPTTWTKTDKHSKKRKWSD